MNSLKGISMTSQTLMYFFFLIMGFFAFVFPLFISIPEQSTTHSVAFQVSVLICTILCGLNALDDFKKLIKRDAN